MTLTDPATGRIATAALDYVSPVASPGARTIRARAVVDNPDGSWRPGIFVTAKLPTRAEAARSVAVPAKAVQDIGGQPVVFVPVPGEAYTFEAREVAVGPEIDGWRPVKSGLVDGESHSWFKAVSCSRPSWARRWLGTTTRTKGKPA